MAVTYGAEGKIIEFGAQADAVTGMVYVKCVEWIKATTAGHDLVVQNTASKTIAKSTCDTNNQDIVKYVNQWVEGIKISTLDSGTVLVRTM